MSRRGAVAEQTPAEAEDARRRSFEREIEGEEEPRFEFSARRLALLGVFIVGAIVVLYFLIPQLAGLEDTWERIRDGDPFWLGLALVFEALSIGGYVMMFRAVCAPAQPRIDWAASYQITVAGIAATRLLAAGGAGGVVLTAWALRRSGMERREVADRMVAFLVLMYGVYGAALVIGGFGLRSGVFPGNAPFGVTVVPAIFGAVAMVLAALISLVPDDFERRLGAWSRRQGRTGRLAERLATAPASAAEGVRLAISLVRSRDLGLAAAFAWWGFNIAVLWAAFEAFGASPPVAVLVTGYFVGMLGNLLPLPAGIGGVDGGMIGAFIAFGVSGGLAVVAVLTYRAFAFYLPTLPGAIGYFQLRRTVNGWKEQDGAGAAAPTG